MKRIAVTAFMAIAIGGCAAPAVWVKAGATAQDYNVDAYECERDSRQSGYYGDGLDPVPTALHGHTWMDAATTVAHCALPH